MKWTAHIHEGLQNVLSSKLRSILALSGILVGTASVVAMLTGGELATNEALKQFKTLGTDLLAFTINEAAEESTLPSAFNHLSLVQANGVLQADKNIVSVAPYTQSFSPMQFAGHDLNGSTLGVTESFASIVQIKMAAGRFISDLDHAEFFCVIGDGVYQQIKPFLSTHPVGQQIQIGKNIFTIAGVAAPWSENGFVYASVDNSVMLPIEAALLSSPSATINNMVVKLAENVASDAVQVNIENYLQHILSNKKYYFRSAKELIARMAKQSEILTVFLGLIGSVSLIVGGIGVMNIMLVSVIERRREIGIRLAIGATPRDIRLLFLVEALMLATVGGLSGIVLGLVVAYVIALFWGWEFTWFLLPSLIGFLVSAATGIFFGFYPAHKASQLNPVEALRVE